ncbi:Formimidoyltransferase-cyclodeaminase [Amphibalanus amphitrite]|uniref:glutamate formimidoyltransferase n=1 Tax=Amphibalanus amphitrite TaxID=1232801 RepID=A0A6A4W262_AMPAM|nr:Formimidoyltransferase-cyclodeaminase [Amphibalanus amphitrite]
MSKIVECVPNFSEGRDQKVIDAISSAISGTAGVTLLDVDPGRSTNRTVVTFVGDPQSVVEGALNGARAAARLIDMTQHKDSVSGWPRSWACRCSCTGQPAAAATYRRTMPQIRAGEYEALSDRLQDERWAPDFGPAQFVPEMGSHRHRRSEKFLIAYNVNILGTKEAGAQAIGWYLDEADIAQVSINLTDYQVTPLHVAFEECKTDAAALKLPVAGSEVVGLLPLDALLQAADFYIQRENLFILEERQKVRLAVERLGLSSVSPFDPDKRIIEYCLPPASGGRLAALPVSQFVREVAARSAAPGGGSVAALCAALGAGLASMVGKMTYGKRQWEHLDADMRRLIPVFHHEVDELVRAVDDDTAAFGDYMAALKLPRATEEETAARQAALQAGLRSAVAIPLGLQRRVHRLWEPLSELAPLGNIATRSDLQVSHIATTSDLQVSHIATTSDLQVSHIATTSDLQVSHIATTSDLQVSHIATTSDLQVSHIATTSDLQVSHIATTSDLQVSHITTTSDLQVSHIATTSDLQVSHIATTSDLQVSHIATTSDLQVSHIATTSDLQVSHIATTSDLQVSHIATTSDLQVSHIATTSDLQVSHIATTSDLQVSHIATTSDLQVSHITTTSDLQVSHIATTSDLQVSHIATTSDLQVSHIATTSDLQVSHIATTSDLQVSHIATISDLQVSHIATTSDLQVSHIATISDLQVSHIATISDLQVSDIGTKADLQVAARCLETASWGAFHNVSINLKEIEDAAFREQTLQEARQLADQATAHSRQVLDTLEKRAE